MKTIHPMTPRLPVPGVYLQYTWNIFAACVESEWRMSFPAVYAVYRWECVFFCSARGVFSIPGVYLQYTWNVFAVCVESKWRMSFPAVYVLCRWECVYICIYIYVYIYIYILQCTWSLQYTWSKIAYCRARRIWRERSGERDLERDRKRGGREWNIRGFGYVFLWPSLNFCRYKIKINKGTLWQGLVSFEWTPFIS